jgi:hypothetical protein
VARAYATFAQLGAAAEAQQARTELVDILGSEEAAHVYLAELSEGERRE